MTKTLSNLLAAAAAFMGVTAPAHAEVFKSVNECVIGRRVTDGGGKSGSIARVEKNGTMCYVKLDSGGEPVARIFWMLHAEGASQETDDKLVPGVYECFGNGRYTFIDVVVTGASSYQSAGESGKFRLDPVSRKIDFESGPLKGVTSKLLRGPAIGINKDGGTFFPTTCELSKSKK